MTLMMATHSPYIINHINLLVLAHQKKELIEEASIDFNDVDVFEITEGYLNNLKKKDQFVFDTRPLSNPISDIYQKYNESKSEQA